MEAMEEPISNDETIADYFIVSEHLEENATPVAQENPEGETQSHAEVNVEALTAELVETATSQIEPAPPELLQDHAEQNENTPTPEQDVEAQPPIQSEQPMEQEPIQDAVQPTEATTVENELEKSDTPQIAVAKVLSASQYQIEEMFEFSEQQKDDSSEKVNDDESYDINPQVNVDDIKVVQDELRELDILVCGSCHDVVHFIEEFNQHKPVCKRKTAFNGNIAETKPQVWAFLLWKNAQSKLNKRGNYVEESSWKLYQKWCKMPERIRNAWVSAGETVMNFSTFGYAKPVDPVLKPLPPKRLEKEDFEESESEKPVIMRKLVHRDAAGEIKEIKSTGFKKRLNEDIENIRNQLEDGDSSQDKEMHSVGLTDNETPRYGCMKVHTVKGKDGEVDTVQEEEFVVEKIVSRRFNPRKKQYEYLLKWEGYPSEQNTWEPAENLEACQHLLKAFEENLAKQSKQKAGYKQKVENVQPTSSSFSYTSGSRPIRYSKQKALSQVKQWCGSIKPDDAELELMKRKMPVTDSDEEEDPYSKKIRIERETDSEDSLGASKIIYSKSGKSGIIRRPGRPPLKPKITNGTTESLAAVLGLESSGDEGKSSAIDAINRGLVKKSTGLSPHNQQVLVANAKGVVKVDPSQVPNLSSGVYIMSNKSGIIKLDSVSPSKALSLKGVSQPSTVKQLTVPSVSTPSASTVGGVTTTTSQSGVIMVNRENQGPSKSGIMRRPGVTPRGRGVGRPPTRTNNVRVQNPNTRLIHSGSRSNVAITPGVRPRFPIKAGVNDIQKRTMDGDRRILGPKLGRGGSMQRGGMRGGKTIGSKVLLKAEGEKTPEPTPPHSPKTNNVMDNTEMQIHIKEEAVQGSNNYLTKINNSTGAVGKDPLVKKTLKPGSIGSVSVSPKKSFTEDNDDIVTISGDDGMVYKVRKSELNNTLMVTGEDGQQCVYVTTGEEGDENAAVLTLDPSYADTVAQLGQVNILGADGENETQFYVKEGEEGELVSLQVQGGSSTGSQEGNNEDGQSQVVAQLVEAGEPAPGGGPRRVVLLLPDGNLMMTEVDEEQYAALELDKYQAAGEME